MTATGDAYVKPKRLTASIETITGEVQWVGMAVLALIAAIAVLAPFYCGF